LATDPTQLPTLPQALARLRQRPVEVCGIVSVGAGRGDDTHVFLDAWPGSRALLIDMDARFVPYYRELQTRFPTLAYDICGAAAEDRVGYQVKSDQFGGAIVSGKPGSLDGVAETPFKRLDTLVREHALEGPYFLKFDTHGAELEILAGAKEVLARTTFIMMEVYNFKLNFMQGKNLTFDEMSLHMKSLGFRAVDLISPLFRPGDAALWQMHLFFARSDHPTFARNSYNPPKPPA
jgi:FkbM family methyltransferase